MGKRGNSDFITAHYALAPYTATFAAILFGNDRADF